MSLFQAFTQEITNLKMSKSEQFLFVQNQSTSQVHNLFASIPRRHKKLKAVSRGTYENSRLCQVQDLDMKDYAIRSIPRAGVVFYTFIDDDLYMCFGRDRKSGDLTDFGGKRNNNEDPVKCAVREGNEESRCAFSEITADQVRGFFCLYSINMLIVFIPVASPNEMDIRLITTQNFNDGKFLDKKQIKNPNFNEISEIVWLNELQISNLFSKRPNVQMFAKVRRFIYSCRELSQNVSIMKKFLKSVITDTHQPYTIEDLHKSFSTSQEILLNSHNYHNYHNWEKEPFSDIIMLSPRAGCLDPIENINNTASVTRRMMRAVHLSC